MKNTIRLSELGIRYPRPVVCFGRLSHAQNHNAKYILLIEIDISSLNEQEIV